MPEYSSKSERTYLFGPFRLSASKRTLFEGDRVVRLGSKAIEILIALVEHAGELVGKNQLVELAWPDTHVVDANLTVQVAALRRALGEDETANQYIVNSPGRGYRFVAPIRILDEEQPAEDDPAARQAHNLPAQIVRLVGRNDVLEAMKHKLAEGRLVSVVGPPGVGKTSVALRLAESLLPQFKHGVWLVDLASITSPSLIPSALTSALPTEFRSNDVLSGLAAALRYKNMLLVFDNCEHLIDGAAAAITELLRAAPGVRVLTTTREPLRIEGEQVCRLPPLDVPPATTGLGPKDVLGYPAVQLFVERAAAIVNDFELTDANADLAAQICRRLDGNPLAIEMAAARVDTFGVKGLASRIDDRMHLLSESHRGTPARHRTIAAALEWSYQLLSERERYVLRCLGIFAGSFTLDAAVAVVPVAEQGDTASILADLVCKSLLSVDIGADVARFRLLEITRAFALAKLLETSERDELATRLASCLADALRKCAAGPGRVQELQAAIQELDNVRGVLNWAFSSPAHARTGVDLTACAVPVWLENGLLTECTGWTTRAIDALEPAEFGGRNEMILKAALGLSVMFTTGMTGLAREALDRSVVLAKALNDREWQLRAQMGLVVFFHRRGDLKSALAATEAVEALTATVEEPLAVAMTNSVKSASLFLHGDHAQALTFAHRAHEYFRTHTDASQIGRWGLNHSVYAQCVIARTYCHQGLLDRTVRASIAAHSEAEASGNPTSICQALSWCGASLFLFLEQFEQAATAIARLQEVAHDNDLQSYYYSGVGFEGRMLSLTGDMEGGERLLRRALSWLSEARYENLYVPFLGHLAELLASDGRSDEAILASTESLERTRACEMYWWLPEALRTHADVLASSDGPHPRSAEDYLRDAIELAQRQGALAYELRAATRLAQLLDLDGRRKEATSLLHGTMSKLTEGFSSILFRRARAVLDGLNE